MTDIDNGPRCLGFSVDRVFGNSVVQVSITLECTVLHCGDQLAAINNRWSITEEFDADWRIRRTVNGVVRVGHVTAWDNALKTMVLPGLPDGFRVEGMNFGRSTTGLELTYQVIMQQMFSAPPWPASGWRCTVREEAEKGGGVSDFVFNCSLTGYVGVRKRDLFLVAIATLSSRINQRDEDLGGNPRRFFLLKAAVVDHLDSNQLDFSVIAQRQWDPGDAGTRQRFGRWLGVVWSTLGLLPPQDISGGALAAQTNARQDDGSACYTDKWFYPDPGGGAANWPDTIPTIFAMRFNQNPCTGAYGHDGEVVGDDGSPGDNASAESGQSTTNQNGTYPGQTEDPPPDESPGSQVAPVQTEQFFTHVELNIRYLTDRGRISMPFSSRASEDQPSVVIRRVHQPVARCVVYYKATRYQAKPTIPKILENWQDANGINYYLSEDEILPFPPQLLPDGINYAFTIELRLSYLMDRPIKLSAEKWQAGSLPWDLTTLMDTSLDMDEQGIAGIFGPEDAQQG